MLNSQEQSEHEPQAKASMTHFSASPLLWGHRIYFVPFAEFTFSGSNTYCGLSARCILRAHSLSATTALCSTRYVPDRAVTCLLEVKDAPDVAHRGVDPPAVADVADVLRDAAPRALMADVEPTADPRDRELWVCWGQRDYNGSNKVMSDTAPPGIRRIHRHPTAERPSCCPTA